SSPAPSLLIFSFFLLRRSCHHRVLHSFPTRRSSYLPRTGLGGHELDATARCIPRRGVPDLAGPNLVPRKSRRGLAPLRRRWHARSEEHTSELQSRFDLVCRLLLEKKKISTLLPVLSR